ncbi:DUF3168 domain-containing protein [Bradyrhizobium sp. 2]|uniref:DUF3168 domain-containing protein n=1 Tax=Bradyrhizobium sp. 2 TaxID=190045 RepID=UPI001FFAC231|nr:DUF3168 domain-containing protein [Bradyrhizobium sp. 2]MCK1460900.1 DUF3168 domain-containing protein [Bradyrhizobium sp. 2]
MSDPSEKLQTAIVARLKGDVALSASVAKRVYDEVPEKAVFPYLTMGGGQVLGDDDECVEQSEVTYQLHVWTQPPFAGVAMKRIAGQVRAAMKAPLAVAGFDVLVQEFVQSQWLDDPDGQTRHAVVEFRFVIVHTS